MTEAQNDYDTFPYDSFVEDSIEIDLEEEIEERNSEIEIAETETELTETETGKAKSYQIKNYLQVSTSKISLTMDMWTSITSLGILAVTIHFVKDDWQFDHFVLDVLYIPSPHNALTIKDAIIEIVSGLKIEK